MVMGNDLEVMTDCFLLFSWHINIYGVERWLNKFTFMWHNAAVSREVVIIINDILGKPWKSCTNCGTDKWPHDFASVFSGITVSFSSLRKIILGCFLKELTYPEIWSKWDPTKEFTVKRKQKKSCVRGGNQKRKNIAKTKQHRIEF